MPKRSAVIVVLSDTDGRMTPEYRAFIPKFFNELGVAHVGIILNTNPIVRVLTKFLARRMGLEVTIHPEFSAGLQAAREALSAARRGA